MSVLRAKSAVVSVVTAGCEVLALSLATLVLAGPALVAFRWIGGLFGAGANYLLNRTFAFAADRDERPGEIVRFAATALLSVTVSTTLWWTLVGLTGADPKVLHPCCMMAVWTTLTYPLMKRWVFGRS